MKTITKHIAAWAHALGLTYAIYLATMIGNEGAANIVKFWIGAVSFLMLFGFSVWSDAYRDNKDRKPAEPRPIPRGIVWVIRAACLLMLAYGGMFWTASAYLWASAMGDAVHAKMLELDGKAA